MSEEAPKLRLRPKLAAESPAAPAPSALSATPDPSAAGAAPAPASLETRSIRLKPRISVESPASGSEPSAAAKPPPAPAFAAVVPGPIAATEPVTAPPAVPTAAPAAAAAGVVQPAAITSASLSANSEAQTPPPSLPLEARTKNVQRIALIIVGVGAVAFAGIAAIAFPRLVAQQAKHDAAAARLEKLIQSGRDDADSPPSADARATNVATTPSTQPASNAPVAPVPSPPAAANASAPAPLPATSDGNFSPSEGSVAFRTWVQELKITGLRTGASPRILLGGASFNVGDVVNADLGIRFDGYDADRRVLRFKDASGALAERRHP